MRLEVPADCMISEACQHAEDWYKIRPMLRHLLGRHGVDDVQYLWHILAHEVLALLVDHAAGANCLQPHDIQLCQQQQQLILTRILWDAQVQTPKPLLGLA